MLKNTVKNIIFPLLRRIKESAKDPLIFFGMVSGILLSAVVFMPWSSLKNIDETSLTASLSSLTIFNNADQFLNPGEKFNPESPDFLLVGGSGIKAAVPPGLITPQILGALAEGFELADTNKIIVEYLVEAGDILSSLAEKFGISANTILWANNLSLNSTLKIGQKLIIPPVSGLIHYVKAGETISDIAQKYKARAEEIIFFNDISSNSDIYPGDAIIVPNGVMPVQSPKAPTPSFVPLAKSYFICPISAPCRITQGLHWYNAVDFSHGQCGEPIFAAAQGKVLRVKLSNSASRYLFGGAGNTIAIEHPNGVVTTYGHLASSLVEVGQAVSQGQIIAFMGGKPGTAGAGKSTGCHVHFGVLGAQNPFSK